jgi:transcriptional antiterminator RfaH
MHRDGGSLQEPNSQGGNSYHLLRIFPQPFGFAFSPAPSEPPFRPPQGSPLPDRLNLATPPAPSPADPLPMHWYCLHTKPLKEAQIVEYLGQTLALETYFPKLRQSKVIRRVRRVVTRPLFPRYLFCRFDPSLQYRAVRYAPDVIEVVHFGEQPTIVAPGIIDTLRSWAGDSVDVLTVRPPLKIGDTVSITDGPMRGLEAIIVQERSDSDRVAVLLATLQFQAQVLISRSQLERVS